MSPRRFPSAPKADGAVPDPLDGPHLFSPEEIQEFQRLAKEHAGADLTEAEAQDVASRLLRTLAIVRDVAVRTATPGAAPHDLRELTLHLRKLQHELELTAEHPSSWRWAIMSLHEAMRLTLALQVQATTAELPKLFDQVTAEHPELPQVRGSIEILERLRTKCAGQGVPRWPVGKDKLRVMCEDCLRVIQRLEPETGSDVRHVEDVLQELS